MEKDRAYLVARRVAAEMFEDIVDRIVDRTVNDLRYPPKRYVRVVFCLGFPGERKKVGERTYYTYEDPWGDLQVGDYVERPSGLAKIVAVDVVKDEHQAPFKLTARYRKEVNIK